MVIIKQNKLGLHVIKIQDSLQTCKRNLIKDEFQSNYQLKTKHQYQFVLMDEPDQVATKYNNFLWVT